MASLNFIKTVYMYIVWITPIQELLWLKDSTEPLLN